MANAGFSAAVDYFGAPAALVAKESSDGMSGSVAEATDAFGDTIEHDEYGTYTHPSTTYAVKENLTSGLPDLGSIVGSGDNKVMVTQIQITTSAGQPPTVTISGEGVPSSITAKRTYSVTANLLARCKAQDVAGAFTAPTAPAAFNSVTTTYSVDFVSATVKGEIKAACATHGRVEVNATVTSPNGSSTLSATSDFTLTAPAAKSSPDEGYTTVTATATKWLVGTEQTGNGGGAV